MVDTVQPPRLPVSETDRRSSLLKEDEAAEMEQRPRTTGQKSKTERLG